MCVLFYFTTNFGIKPLMDSHDRNKDSVFVVVPYEAEE